MEGERRVEVRREQATDDRNEKGQSDGERNERDAGQGDQEGEEEEERERGWQRK